MSEVAKEVKWTNIVFVCVSIFLALFAQFLLYLSKGVDVNPIFSPLAIPLVANEIVGYFLFIVSGVLFVLGVKNVLQQENLSLNQLDIQNLFDKSSYNLILLAVSAFLYIISLFLSFVDERISFVIMLLSFITFSVMLIIRSKYSFKNLNIPYIDIILVVIFAIVGYLLYSYNLDVVPQRIFPKEALLAMDLANSKQNLIASIVYAPQGLMLILQKYLCDVFGVTIFALRIYTVIFSVLAIIIFYFWAKLLFNRKLAIIATIIFLFSHVFIALSKTGVHYTSSIFIMLLVLYLITLSLKYNSYLFVLLSGFVSGIGIYLFENAKGLSIIVIVYFLILAFTNKNLKKSLLMLLSIYFISFLLTILPMIIKHFDQFLSLFNIAPLFAKEYFTHIQSVYKTSNPLLVIMYTVLNTLKAFNIASDNGTLYGNNKSLFDFITGKYFVLGLFASFYMIKDYKFKMLLTTIIIVLIFGSVLKIDPPQYPELSLLIPISALIVSYALLSLLEVFIQYFSNTKFIRVIAVVIISVFCLKVAILNWNIYFNYYIKNDIASSSYDVPTILGNYVNTMGEFYTIYLIGFKDDTETFNTNLETYKFLSKGRVVNEISDAINEIPFENKVKQDVAFVYFTYNFDKAFKLLNQHYPLGKEEVVNSLNNLPILGMYRVTAQEINSKQEKIAQEKAEKEKLEQEKAEQEESKQEE